VLSQGPGQRGPECAARAFANRGNRRASPRAPAARAYRRAHAVAADARRWGRYWTVGATFAGALWGIAAVVMLPALPSYQALFLAAASHDLRQPLHAMGLFAAALAPPASQP
jgi:signal transduction histidine kinase